MIFDLNFNDNNKRKCKSKEKTTACLLLIEKTLNRFLFSSSIDHNLNKNKKWKPI